MSYPITTQRAVRRAFWEQHPECPRKKITNYAGTGKCYPTDTRVAFCDFIDQLACENVISQDLAHRVTL